MAGPFPDIKSKHSLVAKHVTAEKWAKLGDHVTATSGFTLAKAIACAVEFDNQHCGIYAGDEDSYIDFADVFDPLICEYHGLAADFKHTSVSFPCKREVMSRVSSKDSPGVSRLSEIPLRLNLEKISKSAPNSVISTLAPPTWVLVCVPPSTLTCPAGPRTALMP